MTFTSLIESLAESGKFLDLGRDIHLVGFAKISNFGPSILIGQGISDLAIINNYDDLAG